MDQFHPDFHHASLLATAIHLQSPELNCARRAQKLCHGKRRTCTAIILVALHPDGKSTGRALCLYLSDKDANKSPHVLSPLLKLVY